MDQNLLVVEDLKTYFFTRKGVAKAVDGVSFSLDKGESLGLVGESGCGKSVTCYSILRLVPKPAGRIVGGTIVLEGENLIEKSEREMRRIRGRKIALIPQDPMTSLNPTLTIGSQLTESIKLHQKLRGNELRKKARDILQMVRIPSPEERLRNFAHEISGGMKQRVMGGLALSCQPRLLVADEVTSALDVTIAAQYLALLRDMQKRLGLALIFVTHDFGIVRRMCDRVAVMYAGKIMEEARTEDLYEMPLHPYTIALMRSVPKLDQKVESLVSIGGQPPPLYDLPSGCGFLPRCSSGNHACIKNPPRCSVGDAHWVYCWKYA